MSEEAEIVEARSKQRASSKKTMFDTLRSKKPAEKTVSFTIVGEDGKDQELVLIFKAVSHVEYDRLQAKCPPTTEQRSQGEPFNIQIFAPLLLSRVVSDPEMSLKEWEEIWESPSWSRGECAQLFAEAINVCTRGLDIPFTVTD